MPLPRFLALPAERRDTLLTAAAVEFARCGFEGAAIARIMRATSVSKGALYYWFDDKRDLFLSSVAHVLDPLAHAAGKLGPVGSPDGYWMALGAMLERVSDHLDAHPDTLGMVRAVARLHASAGLLDDAGDLLADLEARALELLNQGQEIGAVRGDTAPGLLLQACVAIAMATDGWLDGEGTVEEIAALAAPMLKRLIAPSPTPDDA